MRVAESACMGRRVHVCGGESCESGTHKGEEEHVKEMEVCQPGEEDKGKGNRQNRGREACERRWKFMQEREKCVREGRSVYERGRSV